MDLRNRNVVITGASSGIGRMAAAEFARKGANVALAARREPLLRQVRDELEEFGVSVLPCSCDVSDRRQVAAMHDRVLDEFGSVDVLVNNAGFAIYGTVSDLTVDEIESQMATNYLGMMYCTKHFLPHMLGAGSGHIVNVGSVAASFGLPGIAPYCASKFAMLGFSEGLGHELRGTGVGVTVVSPIMVRTEFFDHPSFGSMTGRSAWSLDPQTVARAILRAAGSPRLEIIVPAVVRGAVWAKHTFPFLTGPIMGGAFQKMLNNAKN